ncbi:MAG: helix-turn-helix transcriptional regulator [Rhodospirillaceae bacterium]|nr:helix-turn-helix transcriptional regulator [Rhodospirillaceae bacterium]
MAARSHEEFSAAKRKLIESIENNELSLGEAVRGMREITGLSQKAYAERIVGISTRILAEIELDQGNPTVDTLNKIGRPFGYTVGFIPGFRKQSRGAAIAETSR